MTHAQRPVAKFYTRDIQPWERRNVSGYVVMNWAGIPLVAMDELNLLVQRHFLDQRSGGALCSLLIFSGMFILSRRSDPGPSESNSEGLQEPAAPLIDRVVTIYYTYNMVETRIKILRLF